ncbi:MAG: C-GCAxxG-C-C family protein [Chloroflexota bacterium]
MHGLQNNFSCINSDIIRASVWISGGGDMATAGSCGAFSSGLIALCAKFAPPSEKLSEEQIKEFERVRSNAHEFRDWFIAEFTGVSCHEVQCGLLGRSFNLMNEEERKEKGKLHKITGRTCGEVVTKTTLKVAEMLSREDKA